MLERELLSDIDSQTLTAIVLYNGLVVHVDVVEALLVEMEGRSEQMEAREVFAELCNHVCHYLHRLGFGNEAFLSVSSITQADNERTEDWQCFLLPGLAVEVCVVLVVVVVVIAHLLIVLTFGLRLNLAPVVPLPRFQVSLLNLRVVFVDIGARERVDLFAVIFIGDNLYHAIRTAVDVLQRVSIPPLP